MNAASWLESFPVQERWRALLLKDGPRIATWALALALGVQAALIVTDLAGAGRRGARAPTVRAPAPSHALNLVAITNAHLFGAAPAPKQDGANAPQTSIPLVLTGTIAGNDPQTAWQSSDRPHRPPECMPSETTCREGPNCTRSTAIAW